ncbi:MAG TPA: Flp pilus assembly protein CpaB [Limnochordia bacterium]|nr:Flp pilus assembly protein CpaB [Limnochordia bacterium]
MKSKAMLFVALGLGLVTSILVYVYVGKMTKPKPVVVHTQPVVVALKPIAPQTPIDTSVVTVRQVSQGAVVPGALDNLDAVVGRVAKFAIAPGTQLTDPLMFAKGVKPGLAFVIPSGKRAVTVAVDEVRGVAGFIKPGDLVDILLAMPADEGHPARTSTVLQAISVLAVAQTMTDDSGKAHVSSSVTLAVTPIDAERLVLAEKQGTLRLALRPAEANTISPVPPVSGLDTSGTRGRATITPVSSAPVASSPAHRSVAQPERAPSGSISAASFWTVEIIRGSQRENEVLHR